MSIYRSPKIPRRRRAPFAPMAQQESSEAPQPRSKPDFVAVCLFGPPRAGVTTVCRVINGASRVAASLTPDFGDLSEQVLKVAESTGRHVVIIDGVPLSADAFQGLWDMRLATPPNFVVELFAPFELLEPRGVTKPAYDQYMKERDAINALAQMLGADIHTAHNNGTVENAVISVCQIAGVHD